MNRINYKILISIFLFALLSNNAQSLTEQEKEEYIVLLNDSSSSVQLGALSNIKKNKIYEALDSIENKFWHFDRFIQTYALKTLQVLNSTKTYDYALKLIDTLEVNPYKGTEFAPDILEEKVEITDILVSYNDFSSVQSVFEIIERDKPNIDVTTISILYNLINNKTIFSSIAKEQLVYIANNAFSSVSRLKSLEYFEKLFGQESVSLFLQILKNDKEPYNRWVILDEYFSKYNNSFDLEGRLREQLIMDATSFIKSEIAKILLFSIGGTSNYKFVQDYYKNNNAKWKPAMIEVILNSYIPRNDELDRTTLIMLDTLTSYTNQSYNYEWLKDEPYKNELLTKLTNAKNYLSSGDSLNTRIEVASFHNGVNQVYQDSAGSYPNYVSKEGYKFLYYYAQYILDRLPETQTNPNLTVRLEDSQGNLITPGSLQYYDSGWKDAINNGDGTFNVITERAAVSIRMTYEGGSQQLDNIDASNNIAVFKTINTTVHLKDSQGNLLDGGQVQYYAAGWKDFGNAANGEVTRELLPKEYSFRMSYGGASLDQKQNISSNNPVVFSTVNCIIRVVNGSNQPINNVAASYYASGWKTIGNTANGEINKELLPKNYSFRVNSNGVNKDKQQDITNNNIVEFVY